MLFLLLAVLSDCQFADRPFIGHAIRTWDAVRHDSIHIDAAPLPRLIFFDERCVLDGERAYAHNGTIKLPDGNEVPPQLMTFAGSYDGQKPFLIQALPPVWRAVERHRDNPQLDRLMRAVFVHEMTHTVQTKAFGERLTEIEKQYALKDLNDDIVQDRFKSNPEYVAAFKAELDALYAVSAEPDPARRRVLARDALRMAQERRARYFTGETAWLAEIEEIFLGMEGAANWAAFRAAILDGATREEAIKLINRGGRIWSQDEGLALFLAVDALMPGKWQEKVFGQATTGAWTLLQVAAAS
jgi:hypothetical protein